MHVAVIGAGFTGTALSIELLERLPGGSTVTLIDRRGTFGPGLAYSTNDSRHLLNISAARMSVRQDEPNHLIAWLARHRDESGGIYGPDSFIPRYLYGLYLHQTLKGAAARSEALLHRISDEVTDLARTRTGFQVELRASGSIRADRVAIATGHVLAELAVEASPEGKARIVANPWAKGWHGRIDRKDRVLLVGTGLTMVDQALSLADGGHEGPITAISRRGRLHVAHVHRRAEPRPIPDLDPAGGLRSIARRVRRQIAASEAHGEDWRPIVDGLRPRLQSIWQALSPREQRCFLRHLLPYWEMHRHRIAPQIAADLNALLRSSRLRIIAGKIEAISASEKEVEVRYRRRGELAARTKEFDWVVNCTGSEPDIRKARDGLLQRLTMAGLIRPGPCGLGIDIDDYGRTLDVLGTPVDGLYTLGPLTKGALWEITAVAEIRQQCADVAKAIAE